MLRLELCLWLAVLLAGCADDAPASAGGDTDADSDTDTGADSDTDADAGSHPIDLPEPACVGSDAGAEQASEPELVATLPASWDEGWLGGPSVYDLDGDGLPEIVAGRHSVLYVWSADGALRWRAPVGEDASSPNDHGESRQYASPVVGDLDGDGDGEIAIAFDTRAAVYDHDGDLLPGWPAVLFPAAGDYEIRSIAAADLTGDGVMELLAVKTSDGPVTTAWTLDGAALPGWPQVDPSDCDGCYDYGGYNQNVGAADLDGDGVPEVVSTYDCCHIGIMYADGSPYPANEIFSGDWVNSVPMFHDLDLAIQGWGDDGEDRDEFTDSPPVFADLDGDGAPEIVLSLKDVLGGELGGVQIWDVPGAEDNCLLWPTARGNDLRDGRQPAPADLD